MNVRNFFLILFLLVFPIFTYGTNHNFKKIDFIYLYKKIKRRIPFKYDFFHFHVRNNLINYCSINSLDLDIDIITDILVCIDKIETKTKYHIEKKIDVGAEKIIFKAVYGDHNVVALALFYCPKSKNRCLKNEIKFSKSLEHNNIIEILDYNLDLFFYTQPLADMDLYTFIQNKELSSNTYSSLLIVLGIARGLLYLSEQNIVHRDIKPDNILLFKNIDGTFTPKIIDFSLSINLERYDQDSDLGLRGTISYMPPDYLRKLLLERRLNLGSIHINDVYSFGILLYELFYRKSMNLILNKKFCKFNKKRQDCESKKDINLKLKFIKFISNDLLSNFRPKIDKDDYLYVELFDRKESINKLISKCWETEFEDRLNIKKIIDILNDLLSDFSYDD